MQLLHLVGFISLLSMMHGTTNIKSRLSYNAPVQVGVLRERKILSVYLEMHFISLPLL